MPLSHLSDRMKRTFSVGGVRFCFEADEDYGFYGFINLFEVEGDEADYYIRISYSDEIDTSGEVIFKDEHRSAVMRDGVLHLLVTPFFNDEVIADVSVEGNRRRVINKLGRHCHRDAFFTLGDIDFYSMLSQKGRFALHASVVSYRGEAIVFSGPSGSGKSTQAGLWEDNTPSEVINGDRALVFYDEESRRYMVSSLPLAGTSRRCINRILPLKKILMISHGGSNAVSEASSSEILRLLILNCPFFKYIPQEFERVVGLASGIAESGCVCKYGCLPDKSSVEYLKKYLYP